MKKLIIAIVVILLLSIAGIYIFIPRKAVISETLTISSTLNSTNRFVTDSAAWGKWLATSSPANGFIFKPGKRGFNTITVWIQNENTSVESRITLLPIK